MEATNRLPRILQRLTEFAVAITTVALLVALGAALFAGDSFDLPVEFTPDEDAYEVAHGDWGEGVIGSSEGLIRFEEGTTQSTILVVTATLVLAVPALAILVLLRQVLRSVADGEPFAGANGRRITVIGVVMTVWAIIAQTLESLAAWLVMDGSSASGLHLEVNIRPDLTVVFLGLVVVVLGAVFQRGSALQAEADLTV